MTSLLAEHQQWFDSTTGKPINNGSVYIGARNLDPVDNAITIYSDSDLTVPISNPQVTDSSGQTANKIYVPGRYSIRVNDSAGVQKYQSLDNGESIALNLSEGSDVASATTTDIWVADGNTLHITGTTGITSFGTAPNAGAYREIIFDGALTLTHSANLNIQGGADITTIAGDRAIVYADTTTQFDVTYFRMDRGPNNINETLVSRASVATSVISSSEVAEDTISITIPATWNTYDVEATGTTILDESGVAGSDTLLSIRVRKTNASGTEIGRSQTRLGTNTPDDRAAVPIYGFIEGETTTGSTDWALTSQVDSDASAYSILNTKWQVRAFRTS